jgi:hypothetical protein
MSFDFRKASQFRLRRDFPEELGFGTWWAALPDAAVFQKSQGPANRQLGLSEAMPQFLGYCIRDGRAYIFTKANHRLEVPLPGLFEEMLKTLSEVLVRQNPPQTPDFGTAQAPLKNVVLHEQIRFAAK